MSNISTSEIILIITTTATAIGTIVKAIADGWGRKEARADVAAVKAEVVTRDERADVKLEHIKELANGTLAALKAELRAARAEIADLKRALAQRQHRDGPSASS